jgi:hypothetical protein
MAFARCRMSETSCLTDLGQGCRGSVTLLGLAGGLCGNIVVAVGKASPRMAWISLVRPTIEDVTQCVSIVSPVGMFPGPQPREARKEWLMALARKMAA